MRETFLVKSSGINCNLTYGSEVPEKSLAGRSEADTTSTCLQEYC